MMKKNTMREIHERMKSVIYPFVSESKTSNKDMACCLGISYFAYCTQLKRNSIPYEEILSWCYRTNTDAMKIFYKKEV